MLRTLPIIAAVLLTACGGLSTAQHTAARNALTTLKRVQAATQVGVTHQQYGQLVIDAKEQVNEAARVLPDGELRRELSGAMDAYADAGQVWGIKVSTRSLDPHTEPGTTLMRKYNLKVLQACPQCREPTEYLSEDGAMQAAWAVANTHLDRAAPLLDL